MTTRFKTSLAAGIAALTLAIAVPAMTAFASSSAKASEDRQDQQPRQGPGGQFGGPPRGGPGGPGMRRPGGPMGLAGFRGLELTDDQKTQLKQINDAHAADFKAVRDKSRAAHDGMQELLTADPINESAIRAKSAEIAAAEADMLILNAKIRKESMQILTADQLAKLKEQREAHGQRQRRPQQQ
jgi:Spy/CpxP family protein refolding chaperone